MNQKENNSKQEEAKPKIKLDLRELKDISHIKELPALPFTPESTTKAVSEFLKKYDEKLIEYPTNQRGNVWSVNDQSELIESMIRGIPIPPIYINTIKKKVKEGNKEVEKEAWEILDGRQRTTAIIDFFKKSLVEINSNLPKGYENLEKYRYEDIDKKNPFLAGKFTEIRLPVVCMTNAPSEIKTEFFQKLNKGGKALTTGELVHSTLEPANSYMVKIMKTPFYKKHVRETDRFGQFVPVSKIMHLIIMAMKEDQKTFVYRPGMREEWKENIITNTQTIQTDLDDLQEERNKKHYSQIESEVERVCKLINKVLGGVEINSPTNNLIVNILTSLLILEDTSHPNAMNHESLKQSFKELAHFWNQGHTTRILKKSKSDLASITNEEAKLITECNILNSVAKSNRAIILENILDNAYANI